jgi:hypothetical protein
MRTGFGIWDVSTRYINRICVKEKSLLQDSYRAGQDNRLLNGMMKTSQMIHGKVTPKTLFFSAALNIKLT